MSSNTEPRSKSKSRSRSRSRSKSPTNSTPLRTASPTSTKTPPPLPPLTQPSLAATDVTLSTQNTPTSSRAQSLHSSVSQQSNFAAADAARHLSQEHVAKTSQEMFRKISEYVKSDMLAIGEDYRLLENMNIATKERYGELAVMAQELMQEVGKLRTTYSDFEPYLERIEEISQQADIISNVASELDEYTKALEVRLKRVSKK
ncbi:biogenesis of lysosome- organelles complex 1 subunit 2 [Podila epigama]|nr:biogenesis of lysosome- organelles complex 1 subunit 2 [Podila epigama]